MRFFPRSTLPTPFSLRTSGQFDGNDGQWSTFLLSVGKPAQQFRVLASTSSMLTWVPKDDGCAGNDVPANCSEWRGVDNVKGGRSDGYIEDFSADFSFTNLFALPFSAHREPAGMFGRNDDVGWSYAFGVRYGTDTMAFSSSSAGGGLQTPHPVPFAMMTRWDYWLGSISLVPWYIDDSTGKEGQGKQTLLEMLANSSAIPSRSYGYTAGAYYRKYGIGLSLLFLLLVPVKNPEAFEVFCCDALGGLEPQFWTFPISSSYLKYLWRFMQTLNPTYDME